MLYAICVSSSCYTGRSGLAACYIKPCAICCICVLFLPYTALPYTGRACLAACYMCVLVRADISYISSVGTCSYRASPAAGLTDNLEAEVRFQGVYPTSNAEFNKDGDDIKKAVAEAAGTPNLLALLVQQYTP